MNLIEIALENPEAHSDDINAVAITHDGALAITASYDKTLVVWDIKSRLRVHKLEGHKRSVAAVVTIPGTHKAVSGSQDSNLAIWDLDTGCLADAWIGHSAEVLSLAVTPDGQTVISGAHDNTLRCWDVWTGRESANVDVKDFINGDFVVDRSKFMFPSEITAFVESVDRVSSLACCPYGELIAIGTIGGTAVITDRHLKKKICCLAGHTDVVSSVAVSYDGKWVLSASYDNALCLWNLADRVLVHRLTGHDDAVFGATFLPASDLAISVSGDMRINFWDIYSGKLVFTKQTSFPLYSCAVSPDGKTILAGTGGGQGSLLWFEFKL